MNCRRIKELIMTDYIDNEISEEVKKQIKRHLKDCSQCRQFEQTLRQAAVEPFRKAEEVQPPDSIWPQIKENITVQEKQAEGFFVGLRDRLQLIFTARRPVFAVATIMAVILIAVIFRRLPFNSQNGVSGYIGEQIEFFSYLGADETGDFDTDYIDLDTAIEKYFL